MGFIFVLAGCNGESPTAPGGFSAGREITLFVSNAQPIVDSHVVVSATIAAGAEPVADGTPVRFTTDLGTFSDNSSTQKLVATTVGGAAKVTLTAAHPGAATVTASLNQVQKSVRVVFIEGGIP